MERSWSCSVPFTIRLWNILLDSIGDQKYKLGHVLLHYVHNRYIHPNRSSPCHVAFDGTDATRRITMHDLLLQTR